MTEQPVPTLPYRRTIKQFINENRELVNIFGILLILIIISAIASPEFRTSKNSFNVLRQAVALGLVSIGQTFVILTGGIDFSVGATISLIAVYTSGMMNGRPGLEVIVPIIILMLGIGVIVGIVNSTLVSRLKLAPFIATIAVASIIQGLVLLYTKKSIGRISPEWKYFAEGMVGPVPFPVIFLALLFILTVLILGRTILGRHIVATGGSEQIARYSGIETQWVLLAAYVICSLSAVLTALFLVSRMAIGDPQVGGLNYDRFDMDSVTAVLIGGTRLGGGKGSVYGTIAGVLIVSVLNNIFNLTGVNTYYQWIVKGIIILVAVATYTSRKSKENE